MIKQDEFYDKTVNACADQLLVDTLLRVMDRQSKAREPICQELGDAEKFRTLASQLRDDALANLDGNLETFTQKLQAAGVTVHWAKDDAQARQIICKVAKDNKVSEIVKSKSMITEEIHLNEALQAEGIEVTETDLGEFIIQLADQKPSHIVLPAIHLTTQQVADIFAEKIGYDGPSEPEELTKAARKYLRQKFKTAQMGISGVNFAVADQGAWAICTNEGNGRYASNMPDIYLGVMGIERIVKDMDSLSVILKMLGRFATGQRITQYVNVANGPCESGGPTKVHIVILDNGRSDILASKYYKLLRCIRCGACLNSCPVFRNISGQSFPGCYSGPMGTVLLPLLQGLKETKNVPKACSLCGRCSEVCPVKIPLADMILQLRNDSCKSGYGGFIEKISMFGGGIIMKYPPLYKLGQFGAKIGLRAISKSGWVKWMPWIPGRWTKVKNLPAPAKKTYLSQIKREK